MRTNCVAPHCDQCNAVRISTGSARNVFCHEQGCPNEMKTWDPDRQQWIRYVQCFTCGCDVEAGTYCGCSEETSEYWNEEEL